MQHDTPMSSSSRLAQTLGVTCGAILHVDDLGMCHSGNQAFLALRDRGLVTCGSVMVPCPWFREIAESAAADPSLDVGIHLTLTSEWEHYRWRPLSTASPRSGLIDPDGYFWRDLESLRHHLVPEAAEVELRMQVEHALAAGLQPTHLDAHMAGAMLPELLRCHVDLARDHDLVPVLPRSIRFAPDPSAYDRCVGALDAAGLPLPDTIRGTLAVKANEAEEGYRRMIETLPAGITHIALHAAMPGDIEAITPLHAPWRMQEYALLASGAISTWCASNGVTTIGYRAVQENWRQHKGMNASW